MAPTLKLQPTRLGLFFLGAVYPSESIGVQFVHRSFSMPQWYLSSYSTDGFYTANLLATTLAGNPLILSSPGYDSRSGWCSPTSHRQSRPSTITLIRASWMIEWRYGTFIRDEAGNSDEHSPTTPIPLSKGVLKQENRLPLLDMGSVLHLCSTSWCSQYSQPL
jgi:hypothetical protein